jgi:SAM-dependent methyltransferase
MNSKELLTATANAFDTHAGVYDAVVETNPLLQVMRSALWAEVERRAPPPARLLDIGSGTGIDAVHFAGLGYSVTAVDSSMEMIAKTRRRAQRSGVVDRIKVRQLAAQDLAEIKDSFDAIYSDLGPLNCVPDLGKFARAAAGLLIPGGLLIVSVMGRYCPWEMAFFASKGNLKEAQRRLEHAPVPVPLAGGIVWTRYYSPCEFADACQQDFDLVTYRALGLFLPPPYLLRWYERARPLMRPLAWLDRHLNHVPLLRDAGDHFLMTLREK